MRRRPTVTGGRDADPGQVWTDTRRGRSRRARGLYVLAVAGFTCALTPQVVEALAGPGSTGPALGLLVLLCLGALGLLCGAVGSLILDVLLLLSARTCGVGLPFAALSRAVDRALPPLSLGVAGAAVCVLVLGAERAFASPLPSTVMALAVVAHLLLLFRGLSLLGVASPGRRIAVLLTYVAVPAVLVALADGRS